MKPKIRNIGKEQWPPIKMALLLLREMQIMKVRWNITIQDWTNGHSSQKQKHFISTKDSPLFRLMAPFIPLVRPEVEPEVKLNNVLGGQIYGGDYVKDIYKMGSDFKFSKISQKLNERRSGHRSLVFKNQVIHVGGKYEQNIEIWYLQPDGDFEVISSDFLTDGWSFFPEFFIVEEDEFGASLL